MAEYIEREAAMTTPVLPKENRQYQTDNLDDAYEQGWMDALDNLKNAPSVSAPQWISVKDRLPDDNDRVIAFRPYEAEVSAYRYCVKWGWSLKTSMSYNGITHWMPLPEPPEEGRGEQ